MKNNLIVASAGSGKTTYLVKKSLEIKYGSILITTFTEANGKEIESKFYKMNGCIPQNVKIQTWFSFLLEHGVRPFQGDLIKEKINGIDFVNQRSGVKYINKTGIPVYWPEDEFEKYYFTKNNLVYTDKLSKLVYRLNENSGNAVIERIANIFRYIFIDEIQDLAGFDLELIKLVLLSKSKTLMVGDPRQVTYHTHDERKYANYKDGNIIGFIKDECKKIECNIDLETLKDTHRNNGEICKFANRVYPHFPTCQSLQKERTEHDGVFLVRKKDIDKYLEVYKPIQLRDSRKTKVNPNYFVMNIGNSKGITMDRVLIYPTKPMLEWLKNHKSDLNPKSRAKLYVAITRAKYSVAFVMDYTRNTNIEGTNLF
jgi:DNA helicase-2/ATP-dependent DNA helicase PcrA